jgi:hypothetical protein
MIGAFNGGEFTGSLYQEFRTIPVGDEVSISGWGFTHADDHIAGSNQAYLVIKFFDNSFNYLGGATSDLIDVSTAGSTWIELSANATVPPGATIVQGGTEFVQCLGAGGAGSGCYDGGSVYFDDLVLTSVGSTSTGDTGTTTTGDTGTTTTGDTGTASTGDTGTASTGDTGTGSVFVGEQLSNPGFEDALTDWVVFPIGATTYAYAADGEGIYGSTELFSTHGGMGAMKMYGAYSGGENITSVYQQLENVPAGSTVTFNGWGYTHADDHVAGTTQAYLTVKYFDAGFGFLAQTQSALIDASTPGSTWTELTSTSTVPAGTTYVQAVAEFAQCIGAGAAGSGCYDPGSAYFDDLSLTVAP